MKHGDGFDTLTRFIEYLEAEGELHRIISEVDPVLEAAEIATRSLSENGPALLFENIRGSKYPLLMNALSSDRRIELALGDHPEALGSKLIHFVEQLMPPNPKGLWRASRSIGQRLLAARVRKTSHEEMREFLSPLDLGKLPILQTWPDDAGKFITLPQVFTYDPKTGKRNVGMYRMQLFDNHQTGMHWQIQKGGGFHYAVAESLGVPLEVAVAIGTDPALLLATIAPLPENIDEVMFAGFLRGRRTQMTKGKRISVEVPTHAEFIIEGSVRPNERRLEGPFGDHFGHYSHAGMFPVFDIKAVTHKKNPIFTATVVGKPPMEDKWMGDTTQLILGPLIKLNHPEVHDVWAFYESGFHNLLSVRVRQRYAKEAMKTALSVATDGQLSLTKCAIAVSEKVNNRSFAALLNAIKQNFDARYDFHLVQNVPLDTLDFTSYTMNLGSKMLIDATEKMGETASGGKYPPRIPSALYARTGSKSEDPKNLDLRIRDWRLLEDVLLVVKVVGAIGEHPDAAQNKQSPELAPLARSIGREITDRLIAEDNLDKLPSGTKIVVAVSEDVNLMNELEIIWGIFTRFDAARDVSFTLSRMVGISPLYEGVMGIDATWKHGYPNPCIMPEEIKNRVAARWSEFGL